LQWMKSWPSGLSWVASIALFISRLIAIEGIPKLAASSAAPQVPDQRSASIPTFAPMFTPETTRSIFLKRWFLARNTMSAGVPEVVYFRSAFLFREMGFVDVKLLPAALRCDSGAIVQISPRPSRASATAFRPGLLIPSSFVMRIVFTIGFLVGVPISSL